MKALFWIMPFVLLGPMVLAQNAFTDLGIGAPVIESRGVVATVDDNGNYVVVAHASGFVLVTDVDTGETVQIPTPPDMPAASMYGSVLASNRKHYMGHGNHIAEFDPTKREWTYHEVGSTADNCYIGVTEGPKGVIWAGGYPHLHLVSFDFNTRQIKDHGQMDPTEAYISSIAVDDKGWVYLGIGTARSNLVAYNPNTAERRQLVDEEDRITGGGYVYPGVDGKVYGSNAEQWYSMYDGQATEIAQADAAKEKQVGSIYWPNTTFNLPDGRRVIKYAMPERQMKIHDPKTDEIKTITFDYTTGGAHISSTGLGPAGKIYSSSGHPMHMIVYDPATGELKDLGPIPDIGGGHINMIAHQNQYLLGGSYGGGRLWAYDTTKPWNPSGQRPAFAMSAEDLAAHGQIPDGEVKYIPGHSVAFFKSAHYGAQATFTLDARADGQYYLHILPYLGSGYCTLQFSFDGQEVGEPYVTTDPQLRPGSPLVIGPMDLKAGQHQLGVRLLDNDSPNPWGALCGVDLTTHRRDDLAEASAPNPITLAQWHVDIGRPRYVLAHPDGHTVFMSGYPGYGRCGGGVGIYDFQTGETSLLTADDDLLPGLTTIELKALSDDMLFGITSALALTGGHRTAEEAEIYMLKWPEQEIVFHMVPVKGANRVISCTIGPDGLVYALTDTAVVFAFDPAKREVVRTADLSEYGAVPRLSMHTGPDGNIYALMSGAVLRIRPDTLEHEKLGQPPTGAGNGGVLHEGILYYSSGSHVWSFDVPEL